MKSLRPILSALLLCALALMTAGPSARAEEAGEFRPHGLPVLYLTIDGGQAEIDRMNSSEDHAYRCTGSADLVIPEGCTTLFGPQQSVRGLRIDNIHGRGNGTWGMPKLPYKIKFADKQDLFGFGANKHWVLLAEYFDNSLIRDWLTFRLAEKLGLEYTPQGAFVDVLMNGEYLGCYFLCEHVRVGKARVNVDELTAEVTALPAIQGGYLLSMNPTWGEPEEDVLETAREVSFLSETPSFSPAEGGYVNNAQRDYIRGYLQRAEDAVFAADGSWADYLDATSLADFWWIQEFSANEDGFSTTSNYLFKPRTEADGSEGKLHFGPLWDMDASWGSAQIETALERGFNHSSHIWLNELCLQPDFTEKLIARWPAVDAELAEITRPGGTLDQIAAALHDAWYADRACWAGSRNGGTDGGRNFEEEIEHIRAWTDLRRAWIGGNLDRIGWLYCSLTVTGEGVEEETFPMPLDQWADLYDLGIPEKEGWRFVGWALEDGTVVEDFLFLDRDVVLTAVFEQINP